MKRKALLSLVPALVMTFMFSIPASAAAIPADAPQGTTKGTFDILDEDGVKIDEYTIANPSKGETTLGSGDQGDTWDSTGDDTNQNPQTGLGDAKADISVWAKVIDTDADAIIYCVDIEWGSMKFVFSVDNGQWDPDTRTYGTGTSAGKWVEASYLDGSNNKVLVRNRSNAHIDAGFDYAFFSQFDGSAGGSNSNNLFNALSTTLDRVQGNFFMTNADALTAALKLTDADMTSSATGVDTLATYLAYNRPVFVNNADPGSTSHPAYGDTDTFPTQSVYFAFSGTPDTTGRKLIDTANFTKVGVITVTITPHAHVDEDSDDECDECGDVIEP